MGVSVSEIGALEVSGMPDNMASEWHLGRTADDIVHGNNEYNHLLNKLANLTNRVVAFRRIAAFNVSW